MMNEECHADSDYRHKKRLLDRTDPAALPIFSSNRSYLCSVDTPRADSVQDRSARGHARYTWRSERLQTI